MRNHSPRQQVHEVKQIARDFGLFIAEKQVGTVTEFIVYRKTPVSTVRLGRRRDPAALRRFVCACAGFK